MRLLKLRLVSKRWKNSVEWCIETHADRHPIITGSENGKELAPAAVGLPINHFNYNNRIVKYHLGATVFTTCQEISDFQNEMANFQGNPFPGKYVNVTFNKLPSHAGDFVIKAMELLKKFGQYVRILELVIWQDGYCNLEICKAVLKGLTSAPYLQSLKIWSDGLSSRNMKATDAFFSEAANLALFPKLDKLESFDWQVGTKDLLGRSPWVDTMIDLYGGRGSQPNVLRKLALELKYWDSETMATNLKNLSELDLVVEQGGPNEYGIIGKVRNVLRRFPNGQLKRLGLRYFPEAEKKSDIYIDELIGMLGDFEIENVAFEKLNLREKGSELCATEITSLYLDDSEGLSYEFLERLPNLRFLSVYVPNEHVYPFQDLKPPSIVEDDDSLAIKIRRYFWKADSNYECKGDCSFDIWKVYEKLEILSATIVPYAYRNEDTACLIQFVRECGSKPFLDSGGMLTSSERWYRDWCLQNKVL